MRMILKTVFMFALLATPALAQDRLVKSMVGPYGDQTRIVLAFMEPLEDGYRLQSMIVDVSPANAKNSDPSTVHLDLTSTVRNATTGAKKQTILILRWKNGELESKCEGEWKKKDISAAFKKIIELTTTVIQTAPQKFTTQMEITLPAELERKISALFDSLGTEDYPCLRKLV